MPGHLDGLSLRDLGLRRPLRELKLTCPGHTPGHGGARARPNIRAALLTSPVFAPLLTNEAVSGEVWVDIFSFEKLQIYLNVY